MKDRLIYVKKIFYVLMGIFVLLVSYFLAWFSDETKRALFPFVAILAVIFFVLGTVLIFLTLKLKVEKKIKVFLILTGTSAVGFLMGVILHNLFYGLGMITGHIIILKYVTGALNVVFFIIAILVCPIVFLIGAVGSIIMLIKKKK